MKPHLQDNPYLSAGEGNSPSIQAHSEFTNLHENQSADISVIHNCSFLKKKVHYSSECNKKRFLGITVL
jgi:hypothetical protein